jgi:ATP-binding cassette subfamily C protein LapB
MTAANRAERETAVDRERLTAELVAGRTTVKALALERAMRPRWEQRHAATIERAIARGARADAYTNLATTLTMTTTVALTAVGAVAILNQQLTIGALIATNILSSRLLGPLTQLVGQWRTYAACSDAAKRLGEVFSLPDDRKDTEMALERPSGDLVLEGVSFAYAPDARPTVDGVRHTFTTPGVHALVGRNGSGKTTLLKLLQGLYTPTEGRILLGGADVSQFSREQLARWIGYVPQECTLFAGTLRDNIAYRDPDATDEDVIAAASLAGAHPHIVDLPDGYGTEVGEAGVKISAGQRQRIAIARALLSDPPVVLMDEPSSNLDREAENDLRRMLSALGKERLIVIVTHSPILLGACDRLVALEKGRIALAGPTEEILPRMLGGSRKPAAAATSASPAAAGAGAAGAQVMSLSTAAPDAEPAQPKRDVGR